MSKRAMSVALAFLLTATMLPALDAQLKSVEIDLVVRTDGKADVFYSLDWSASGGQMHGFYFQGAAATPVFNLERCYGDLGSGERVPLEIRNTLTLREANGKTMLTLHGQPLYATDEELFKDMFPSMQQGFGGTFDQLDAYLARPLSAGRDDHPQG